MLGERCPNLDFSWLINFNWVIYDLVIYTNSQQMSYQGILQK